MSKSSDNLTFIYFLMQGAGTLISWNAILNGLDYYQAQFGNLGYNCFSVLPIAVFVAQGVANLAMTKISKALSFNTRIIGPLVVLSIILFSLPIVTHFVTGTLSGFWIIMGMLFVLGFCGTVYQSSASGMMSLFPGKYSSIFLSGTGAAGLLMNACRAIAILIFAEKGHEKETSNAQIIFYFGIASLLMVSCMVIHMIFVKTEYYISQAGDQGEKDDQEISLTFENQANMSEGKLSLLEAENDSGYKAMVGVFKAAMIPILCLLTNYIQTFTVFPGVMIAKNTGSFEDPWKMLSMLTVFNLFDIVGKAVAEKRDKYNDKILIAVTAFRFVFLFTFIIQVILPNFFITRSLAFCYFNIALFALTNGFITTGSFIIAPEKVEGKKKQLAGFLSVTALTTGIMLGTIIASAFADLKPIA